MYLIDSVTNTIKKLEEKSFSELGFREREHLQQWIANSPNCLGEDLLIIQEEFSGFEETRERLDLLALDKGGNIVVIENKLDDTGRDVTWQALKYASYCSSLTKEQILNIFQAYLDKKGKGEKADAQLEEFFETEEYDLNVGNAQRIILIAGYFRKEVTSTVMWLLNYGLQLKCFKVTPYKMEDKLFLNFEQIIPVKDAEDLIIKMVQKQKEEISAQTQQKTRHIVRKEFWTKLLQVMNEKSPLFQNISPGTNNWINAGVGISGLGLDFVIGGSFARGELYIDKRDKEENKRCFDFLFERKETIEHDFGEPLIWERLDDKQASRIKFEKPAEGYNKEEWDQIIEFMTDGMVRLESALRKPLKDLNRLLKNK